MAKPITADSFLKDIENLARDAVKGQEWLAVWRTPLVHESPGRGETYDAVQVGMLDELKPDEPSALIFFTAYVRRNFYGSFVEIRYERPCGQKSRSSAGPISRGGLGFAEECLLDLETYAL